MIRAASRLLNLSASKYLCLSANTSVLGVCGLNQFFETNATFAKSYSSVESPPISEGYISKFFKRVGWLDHNKTRLKLAGYSLYECVPASVDYEKWVEVCELPDAFNSWFVITELHIWILMVRCMAADLAQGQETKYIKDGEGRTIRNAIVEAMWADVGNRIKLLEDANPSVARKQVSLLSEQFQAALMSYDEGFAGDKELAAAIWRRFFHMQEVDADKILKVLKFIRIQLAELDKIPTSQLKSNPLIKWIPIDTKKR